MDFPWSRNYGDDFKFSAPGKKIKSLAINPKPKILLVKQGNIILWIIRCAYHLYGWISAKLETGYIAALLGFAACYSIDKVYQVTNKITRLNIHSASVFLSAMLFTALLVNNYLLLYTVLILKFLLYLYRKIYFRIQNRSIKPVMSSIRILFGFVLPILFLQMSLNYYLYLIFGSILFGEIIDRIEFYLELDISTPRKSNQ